MTSAVSSTGAPAIQVIRCPVISGLPAPSPAGWTYRRAPRRFSSSYKGWKSGSARVRPATVVVTAAPAMPSSSRAYANSRSAASRCGSGSAAKARKRPGQRETGSAYDSLAARGQLHGVGLPGQVRRLRGHGEHLEGDAGPVHESEAVAELGRGGVGADPALVSVSVRPSRSSRSR